MDREHLADDFRELFPRQMRAMRSRSCLSFKFDLERSTFDGSRRSFHR